MIICYINNKAAYPAVNSDIKITLLNPFIKDGDEKSMEVVFPMDIPENREIFGALNRLDTHFKMDNYENCRLISGGIEIINGTGTITSVTEKEVKLQILAGKSYLKFKASFDNVYIDEIYYGDVEQRHQHLKGKPQQSMSVFNLVSDINNQGFIGEPGKYAFLPIHDETNDLHINMPSYLYDRDNNAAGVSITFKAIQPNLMFVMDKVMEKLGYKMTDNFYNTDPWNKIYIASAKMTLVMSRTLPHWTAYKFLDEFRKLFNATYIFDEGNKTVRIVPFGDSGTAGTEQVEPLEEFSTSFEEDGVEYLGSSNLEYNMSDCDRGVEVLSQDVMKTFERKEYESINDLYSDFDAMTEKEKLTTIFHCPVGFFYGTVVMNDDGAIINHLLKECGWFSPLVRADGGSTVELNIVPVAMQAQKAHCVSILVTNRERATGVKGWTTMGGQEYEYDSIEANINCDYPANEQVMTYGDGDIESNSLEYVTVQDVVEDGEALPEKTDEDAIMEIFFASGSLLSTSKLDIYGADRHVEFKVTAVNQPVAFTDYRFAAYHVMVPKCGLGLNQVEGVKSVGYYHNRGIKIRQNVNGNNEICIKFPFDGKPDPRKLYIIRNRKFICSKIELHVNENGIDRIKTGYFYEML